MSSPLIVLHPITGSPLGSRVVLNGATLKLGELSRVPSGSTVHAPATPFDEGVFAILDAGNNAASSPIVIDGNGRTIEGAASHVLDVSGGCNCFVLVNDVWREIAPIYIFQAPSAVPILMVGNLPGAAGGSGDGNGLDAVIAMPDADYSLTDEEDAASVVRFTGGAATGVHRATWKPTISPTNKRRFLFNETAFAIDVANGAGGLVDTIGAGLSMIVVFNSVGARNAATAGP